MQFAGPQHTPNAPFGADFFYADVASFAVFSPLSVAGSPEAGRLATSASEYNTYLGLPLLVVVLACVDLAAALAGDLGAAWSAVR